MGKLPEERPGLVVPDVMIKRVFTPPSLVKRIAAKRGLPKEEVEEALRYNIMTVKQFAKITGTTINTVHQKFKGYKLRNGRMRYHLLVCYPFGPDSFKFIFRERKAQAMIERSVKWMPAKELQENNQNQ